MEAERRAGELLAVMDKAQASGSNQHATKERLPEGTAPRLTDLGITYKQSMMLQMPACTGRRQSRQERPPPIRTYQRATAPLQTA